MSRRFLNQRFYVAHDDRVSSEDHVIRRLVTNQGRIGKNKQKNTVKFCFMDDDTAVYDNRMVYGGKGSRKGRGGYRGGDMRDSNMPGSAGGMQKKSFWYQITVINGSRYARTDVLSSIENYISPQKIYPICYQIVRNDSQFYVERWQNAQLLLSCTRKISMHDGQPLILRIKDTRPPLVPVDDTMLNKMKLAMSKRYVAENKALDLTRFVRDPEFIDGLFCNLSRSPVLSAAIKIISENIPDLVALNLSSNAIYDFEHSATEFKKLKSLRILHLSENNITNLSHLNCFKEMTISELKMDRNPVVKQFSDKTYFVRYGGTAVTEVRKRFPKLTKLDDTELMPLVTFDVGEESLLPSPQAAFICNPEGRTFVKAFLSQYYQIYDSDNRSELAQAYADNAVFSITASYPHSGNNNGSSPRLNAYFTEARNLLRVPDFPRRKNRLKLGKTEIVDFFHKQLPKSQHDLLSFAVDLPFFTPALISLSVAGVFRERGVGSSSNWPIRHFSRSFLIVPMGSGFCIVNETLFITNCTEEQAEVAFKVEPAPPEATVSSPVQQVASPGIPTSPVLDDSVKMQMVQAVSQQTGMNLDWSKKCLDETKWNYEHAIWTFGQIHKEGKIPAEAFIK